MPVTTVNPADGMPIDRYENQSVEEILAAAARVHAAFPAWRDRSPIRRAELMGRLAVLLREHAGDYAELITLEMGKTLREALMDLEPVVAVYIGNGIRP